MYEIFKSQKNMSDEDEERETRADRRVRSVIKLIHRARDRDDRDTIAALKKEFRSQETVAFLQCAFDMLECHTVEMLIKDLKIDVNQRNALGETILFQIDSPENDDDDTNSSSVNDYDISMLLCIGCDPNIQDNEGNTALHICMNEDVSYILYGVTDLTLKNKHGMTPLDLNRDVRRFKHMDVMEKYIAAIAYAPGGPVFASAKESFDAAMQRR
jgi:hypothetical protein